MSSESPDGVVPTPGDPRSVSAPRMLLTISAAEDLGAAFHASAIPQWVFDRETLRFLAVNQAAVRTYGYTHAEFLELTVLDVRPPEDRGEVFDAIDRGGRAPFELSAVVRHRWRSGEVRFVRVPTSPIEFARRPALLAQVFDITAERRMEQALADARRRLDSALIAGEVGTFEWDVMADRLWGDENFARIFNLRLEDHAAPLADYMAAIHPDDRASVAERVARTVQTGCDYEAEYRIVGRAGERWVIARGKAERDASGRVVRFAGVVLDVTDRRRAEKGLRESEARYRTLFESIEHGFCIVEVLLDASGQPADYRFLQANPAFAAATGLLDARGRTALEMIPDLERWWIETYGRVALTGEAARFENYSAPMSRWFDVYAFRFGRPEHRQVAIFFKNITEQKRAEEEREAMLADNARLFREAQAANELKDQFLATLSHELRTPLNAVLGWLAVVKNVALDPAAQRRALEIVERNARAQTQLIADILDVSSIAAGRLSLATAQVHVPTAIEQVMETIRPTAEGKRLVVTVDDTARDALVSADPARLQQIVWNLLSNAVKFTREDGRIEVRATANQNEVSIAVSDDGIGLAPDFLPHVFDRFRQADGTTTRAHSGMGLGLAIVRDLVQMHGGTIEVQSPGRNQGAMFVVRLPRVVAEALEQPEPDATPGTSSLGVLVVDDHPDTRDMMRLILRDRGMQVATAGSADEAVAAYLASPCDVALIDISMPGEDGYGCLRQLQAAATLSARRLAAIALTAHAREQDRASALEAGFAAHVAKPVDVDALLATIRQLREDPA